MSETPARKSLLAAFLFSFLLPGYGLAYVFDGFLWFAANFVAHFVLLANLRGGDSIEPWLMLSVVNGMIAVAVAARTNSRKKNAGGAAQADTLSAAKTIAGEPKSPPFAFIGNAIFPGLGVWYALDEGPEIGGLPGVEWGLINILVAVALFMGNVPFVPLILLNGTVGFFVAAYAKDFKGPAARQVESS
ncbi:MAG: hypothetical protein AB7K24_18170 [Gemmataceae bacterium]